jgi:hypothetical protein
MTIYADMDEWDAAQAILVSDEGANASERVLRRVEAARQMHDIEARYERRPGGFSGRRAFAEAERARREERIKKIVDAAPPLTDEQLCKLALLLRPLAIRASRPAPPGRSPGRAGGRSGF